MWVAAGSVIGGPVVVGDNVVIGANSVITKDVPPNRMVYGANRLDSRKIAVEPGDSYKVLSDSEGGL